MHEFSAASQQSLVASYNEINDNSLYGFSCAVTLGIEWFLLDLWGEQFRTDRAM